ncbi:MAG: YvcK family protein [Clostridium sp.]
MKLREWATPGIGIKRWLFQMLIGIFFVSYAMIGFIGVTETGVKGKAFLVFILLVGIVITVFGLNQYTKKVMTIIRLEELDFSKVDKNREDKIQRKNLLIKGPKIVVIGGGTGLSNMLSGLKKYTFNITAIVTVADDGGGSGMLRQDLGMLPPGDIRNCIISLADTEPLMEKLFRYRFKDGALENQSFGNLFLAAMNGVSDNFLEAVKRTSEVLAVTGQVLPVTLENVDLYAKLENGSIVRGESSIPMESLNQNSPIERVFIEPADAKGIQEAIDAIIDADAVVLGPGSVYTSIIPNLMVKDVKEALLKTEALKIYVSNVMTQPGESDNYSVEDHIRAIIRHCEGINLDYTIVNKGDTNEEEHIKERYLQKGSNLVKRDGKPDSSIKTKYIECDMIKIKRELIRHDEDKLSKILMKTIVSRSMKQGNKRIEEYMQLAHEMKKEKKDKE